MATHTGFLSQIRGKRARRKADGRWLNPRVEVVQELAGTQSVMTFIGRIKGMVSQWVVLWPSFDVSDRENICEGGGHKREAWWNQESLGIHIRTTLYELLSKQRGGNR